MLGLMYGLAPLDAMRWVQFCHDLRIAPMGVPSPQTEPQRQQVVRVLTAVRRAAASATQASISHPSSALARINAPRVATHTAPVRFGGARSGSSTHQPVARPTAPLRTAVRALARTRSDVGLAALATASKTAGRSSASASIIPPVAASSTNDTTGDAHKRSATGSTRILGRRVPSSGSQTPAASNVAARARLSTSVSSSALDALVASDSATQIHTLVDRQAYVASTKSNEASSLSEGTPAFIVSPVGSSESAADISVSHGGVAAPLQIGEPLIGLVNQEGLTGINSYSPILAQPVTHVEHTSYEPMAHLSLRPGANDDPSQTSSVDALTATAATVLGSPQVPDDRQRAHRRPSDISTGASHSAFGSIVRAPRRRASVPERAVTIQAAARAATHVQHGSADAMPIRRSVGVPDVTCATPTLPLTAKTHENIVEPNSNVSPNDNHHWPSERSTHGRVRQCGARCDADGVKCTQQEGAEAGDGRFCDITVAPGNVISAKRDGAMSQLPPSANYDATLVFQPRTTFSVHDSSSVISDITVAKTTAQRQLADLKFATAAAVGPSSSSSHRLAGPGTARLPRVEPQTVSGSHERGPRPLRQGRSALTITPRGYAQGNSTQAHYAVRPLAGQFAAGAASLSSPPRDGRSPPKPEASPDAPLAQSSTPSAGIYVSRLDNTLPLSHLPSRSALTRPFVSIGSLTASKGEDSYAIASPMRLQLAGFRGGNASSQLPLLHAAHKFPLATAAFAAVLSRKSGTGGERSEDDDENDREYRGGGTPRLVQIARLGDAAPRRVQSMLNFATVDSDCTG